MGGSNGGSNGGGYWMNPLPPQSGGMYTPWGTGSSPINPDMGGLPSSFPMSPLTGGLENYNKLFNSVGNTAPAYYQNAQSQVGQAESGGLTMLNDIYGTGLGKQQNLTQQALPQAGNFFDQAQRGSGNLTGMGVAGAGDLASGAQNQISGMEDKNIGQVNSLLDNYNQNFVQQLGPQGKLGQQLMGEFNNYGLTPDSGAFQSALGNQLGSLGAQNALTLGREALQPGINAQYGTLGQGLSGQLGQLYQGLGNQQNLLSQGAGAQTGILSQGLGGQLGTANQGTQQAGQFANQAGLQNINLGSQGALSPLSYENMALQQQAPLINEMAQAPLDWWNSQNNQNFAQQMGQQNNSAQMSAAQMGMLGGLGGAGITGLSSLAAAGK